MRFLADKGDSNCRAGLRVIARQSITPTIKRFLFLKSYIILLQETKTEIGYSLTNLYSILKYELINGGIPYAKEDGMGSADPGTAGRFAAVPHLS
jgi:hypothetical protein